MTTSLLAARSAVVSKRDSKKALLVVDVQENLLNVRSRLHMDPGAVNSFIENLNKTIDFFHAHNLPVLYIVNEWTNPVLNLLTGNVCKRGAKGTGIDNKVKQVNDNIYRKSRMDALTNRQLLHFLQQDSISQLYISGLFAEACIKKTATGAIKRHYNTLIVEDAVGSGNSEKKLASLLYCERKGANIISTDQLFNDPGTTTPGALPAKLKSS